MSGKLPCYIPLAWHASLLKLRRQKILSNGSSDREDIGGISF
jgi:hypothetical protein